MRESIGVTASLRFLATDGTSQAIILIQRRARPKVAKMSHFPLFGNSRQSLGFGEGTGRKSPHWDVFFFEKYELNDS